MTIDERIYRQLLRLYPRAFHRRFEGEMMALFTERRNAAAPGLRGHLSFYLSVVIDLAKSMVQERWPADPLETPARAMPLGSLGYDLRQAWRILTRAPTLALFVIVLMALSIGATTAAFSVVNTVLLRPFPFERPDRLVVVWERRGIEDPRNNVGAHEYPEWKARSRSFERMAAIVFDRDFNLTGAGDPMELTGARVTSDFFPVMGVAPVAGRIFTTDEDRPGHGQVVVISERLWRDRFGGDRSVIGRPVTISGEPYTVVGVMPADFQFPPTADNAAPDIWTPIAEPFHLYRGRHYMFVVARLKDGVTLAQAQTEMDAIAAGLEAELPQLNKGHGVNYSRCIASWWSDTAGADDPSVQSGLPPPRSRHRSPPSAPTRPSSPRKAPLRGREVPVRRLGRARSRPPGDDAASGRVHRPVSPPGRVDDLAALPRVADRGNGG